MLNGRDDAEANTDTTAPSPIKYLSLQRVYSASTQYGDNGNSKKIMKKRSCSSVPVKGWNMQDEFKVYRRNGRKRSRCYFEMLTERQEMEIDVDLKKENVKEVMSVDDDKAVSVGGLKKGKIECGEEGVTLDERLNSTGDLMSGIQLRQCRNSGGSSDRVSVQKKRKHIDLSEKVFGGQTSVKRWVG